MIKTIRVVAAVIKKNNRIFCTQRGYGEFKGGWEFPGGKIEEGETPQKALVREIKEELNIDIRVGKLIETIEYDYPDFHLSMDCFWCDLLSGEIELKEHKDAKWLDKTNIDSVEWLPADEELIAKIKEEMRIINISEDVLKVKKSLDRLNYGSVLKINENWRIKSIDNIKRPVLDEYEPSQTVKEEYERIKIILKKENKTIKTKKDQYHIGTISAGTHSIDYANIFGFDIDNTEKEEKWIETPIMFVFENPSSNIDCSFARSVKKAVEIEKENWQKLSCEYIWHADFGLEEYEENKKHYGEGNFRYFENKGKYSELLLSIILEFKLANFYTTNMFRYEIFQKQGKKKEKYNNLQSVEEIIGGSDFKLLGEKNSFTKELKIFKPDLIFATQRPYNYLIDYYKKKKKKPIIVCVPHPSNRYSRLSRFCENAMSIVGGLYKANIIDEREMNKKTERIINKYLNISKEVKRYDK